MNSAIIIREAVAEDIPQLHRIRMRVKENVLNNPLLVQEKDYVAFVHEPNKGWVAISNNQIAGFAFVDVQRSNVWALFVDPAFEARGLGKLLHREMVKWYFSNYSAPLWLTTAPRTRAEKFYSMLGWKMQGLENGEVRFIMDGLAS